MISKKYIFIFSLIFILTFPATVFAELEWIDIEGTEFVADSFNGVDALYTDENNSPSDTTYSCAAYIKKYYEEIYNISVYNLYDDGPPLAKESGITFREVSSPKVGDIVFWDISSNKNNHSAIVRKVKGDKITLIEQNYKWGTQAGIDRELEFPDSTFKFYRASDNILDYEDEIISKEFTKSYIEKNFDEIATGNITRITSRGVPKTDKDKDVLVYEMYSDDFVKFTISDSNISGYYFHNDDWVEIKQNKKISATNAFFAISGYDSKDEDFDDEDYENNEDEDNDDNLFLGNNNTSISNNTSKKEFTDLTESHWAYGSIQKCISLGIFSGYEDGTFLPDKTISRGEFSVILNKLANNSTDNISFSNYADISHTDWYFKHAEGSRNYLHGYMEMDGNEYFYPNNGTKREDACNAFVKVMNFDISDTDIRQINAFSDKNKITIDLQPAVALSMEKGIISGFEDKTFRPQDTITRAQAAVMIDKLLK